MEEKKNEKLKFMLIGTDSGFFNISTFKKFLMDTWNNLVGDNQYFKDSNIVLNRVNGSEDDDVFSKYEIQLHYTFCPCETDEYRYRREKEYTEGLFSLKDLKSEEYQNKEYEEFDILNDCINFEIDPQTIKDKFDLIVFEKITRI